MKKINLSIPEPCHENWDAMTPGDKGRFCGSCQKTVVDFTNMSDRQLAEFFKKPSGSVCGRFQQDQLQRDISIPRKRIPWIKYFFQFSLPAFLISMKTSAQGKVVMKGDTIDVVPQPHRFIGKVAARLPDSATVSGKVLDESGQAIAYASIVIKGTRIGVTTNSEGYFSLKMKETNSALVVSAVGCESREVIANKNEITIILNQQWMGEVVIVGAIVRKPSKPIPLIKKNIDTAFRNFSVYPNPVQSNSSFKIELKKFEKGSYNLAVVSSSGELVQTTELVVENKKQVIDQILETTAAGVYFLRLTNKSSGKIYTEKIVVQ